MKHKWTLDELIDSWTLLPNELAFVNRAKTDHTRLGLALLLKYFQIEGRFPRRQRDVPQAAIEFVARQLEIATIAYASYRCSCRSKGKNKGGFGSGSEKQNRQGSTTAGNSSLGE